YIHYIPWPVISGFTNGIGIIIALQQLPGLFGLEPAAGHESILLASWQALQDFAATPQLQAPLLTLLAVAVLIGWGRPLKLRAIPAGIVALLAVTLVSLLPAFSEVPRIGLIPQTLPEITWPQLNLDLTVLVRSAMAIAILAALESLLSAVVADGMTVGERHD